MASAAVENAQESVPLTRIVRNLANIREGLYPFPLALRDLAKMLIFRLMLTGIVCVGPEEFERHLEELIASVFEDPVHPYDEDKILGFLIREYRKHYGCPQVKEQILGVKDRFLKTCLAAPAER